jgi:hypothetical protein
MAKEKGRRNKQHIQNTKEENKRYISTNFNENWG